MGGAVTELERIQIARAEEQMADIDMSEPVRHDGWAIKPTEYDGRADGKGKTYRPAHCRACDRKPTHGTYCKPHWDRIRRGLPVDADLYVITKAEVRRLSSGKRFGGGLWFGREEGAK